MKNPSHYAVELFELDKGIKGTIGYATHSMGATYNLFDDDAAVFGTKDRAMQLLYNIRIKEPHYAEVALIEIKIKYNHVTIK